MEALLSLLSSIALREKRRKKYARIEHVSTALKCIHVGPGIAAPSYCTCQNIQMIHGNVKTFVYIILMPEWVACRRYFLCPSPREGAHRKKFRIITILI
jgi:hypothetical protein